MWAVHPAILDTANTGVYSSGYSHHVVYRGAVEIDIWVDFLAPRFLNSRFVLSSIFLVMRYHFGSPVFALAFRTYV